MTSRGRHAFVSLAVFLGGGVLAPVGHLAWHRPDHSHGPDGGAIGLSVEHRHGRHSHRHGAAHDQRGAHDHAGGRAAIAPPPSLPHGHGSLAHFGLALLSAPPPLALPLPSFAGPVPPAPRALTASRFQPKFPLPRPPPAAAFS